MNLHESMARGADDSAARRCAQLEKELGEVHAEMDRLRAEMGVTRALATRASHQARHDSLTALPNRRYLLERVGHVVGVVGDAGAVALLYLDLDGFKSINDIHGHGAGDEVLRIVAARLLRAVRAADLVCRLGGDEFALLLAGLRDRAELARIAAKLFATVSAPLTIGARALMVRPSIGIACSPVDGTTVEALLHRADAAMYRAKARQTGYAFFDDEVGAIAAASASEAS